MSRLGTDLFMSMPRAGLGRGRSSRRAASDLIVRALLFICAFLAVIFVILIIVFLFREGEAIFRDYGFSRFLFGKQWNPTGYPPAFGAWPMIVGTLLVMLGAMLFAIPLGIASAIFIAELATPQVRQVLKSSVEVLAGIPSVVFGFFGLIVLTTWIRITFDQPSGESWLAGSLLLGIMALPTIISVSEDAITSVPRSFREASLAMGATRWQTISTVVVPAAMSGITAAIILGIGRAIGETMAVLMVTGNAPIIPHPITNVFSPVRTITGTIGIETGEVASGTMHYHALFGLALVLLVITLVINIVATIILGKIKQMHNPTKARSKRLFRVPPAVSMWMRRTLTGLLGILAAYLTVVALGLAVGAAAIGIGIVLIVLMRRLSRKATQVLAFGTLFALTLVVLGILAIVIYYIGSRGIGAIVGQSDPGSLLRPLNLEFLMGTPRDSGRTGGIFPAIVGTFYLVGGAIAFALPIGIGAAIYLNEYTLEGKVTKVIRAGLDIMNGTPSIVFGLFGYAFLVIYLKWGVSLLAGQVALAFMVLPTIVRTTEEALKAVPMGVREGSLALGATKWQTTRKVVLPAATPGVMTGAVLSIGRAAGETAPIMFTAVVFSQRFLSTSLAQPVMALPYHLYILSTSVPDSARNASGTALVLLVVVTIMYLFAIVIRQRFGRRLKW